MSQEDTARGSRVRESELVLPPGVFAYVLDETKGNVTTYCGPNKSSLSQTDSPVLYDNKTGRFTPCKIENALQVNITARQGEYIVLRNTSNNGSHPDAGKAEPLNNDLLNIGQTENIPGPVSFPLWPTQTCEVVPGHHLRSNQYLLVRVYDEEAAKDNWDKAVIKEASTGSEDTASEDSVVTSSESENLVTGRLMTVKGTNVSFYIPPTGIEVLKDETDSYVRDAVTLERLEYCILLNEDGNKDYKRGPEVVFPQPTEDFVTSNSSGTIKRKFRAYELNDNSGLYIKVIADYEEENSLGVVVKNKQGDELFLTGDDTAIYFPRPEHAIIKYGEQEKHYSIAIPKGEARYVLDRNTGDVELVTGPTMFLADPRKHVSVRRVLDDRMCGLYFPGNTDVLSHNRVLRDAQVETGASYVEENDLEIAYAASNLDDGAGSSMTRGYSATKRRLAPEKSTFGDEMSRGTTFTPPRMITLDTKFDGAVTVNVWTGYAIQVVNKSGDRRVIQGPQTVLLEYDEYLERLSLSKGRPKNRDNKLDTVYLRVMSNPVSDKIVVKTKDLVDLTIDLKYLVRFVADESNWFNVDNYVQYLCDHMRSLIGNHVRQLTIQEFYANAAEILRDLTLGKKVEGADGRDNRLFGENDMEVYDLEVITVAIDDYDIADLLSTSQQEELVNSIKLETEQRSRILIEGQEVAKQGVLIAREKTNELVDLTKKTAAHRDHEIRTDAVDHENAIDKLRAESKLDTQATYQLINESKRGDRKADEELSIKFAEKELSREIERIVALAAADETRAKSVTPGLIEALASIAKTGAFESISEHLAPLSVVRGESIEHTFKTLMAGTGMEPLIENIGKLGSSRFVAGTGTDGMSISND